MICTCTKRRGGVVARPTAPPPPLPAWHFHCIDGGCTVIAVMSDPQELAFGAEFPAATREQWLKLVDGVLKGAPFEKRLTARSYDGLAIEPLYARDARAEPIVGRLPGAAWTV